MTGINGKNNKTIKNIVLFDKSISLEEINSIRNNKNSLIIATDFESFTILKENKIEQEKYINSTLLLEPKNEEAMYLLIDIELKRSNFIKVEELKKNFKNICLIMCEKLALINSRLKELQ